MTALLAIKFFPLQFRDFFYQVTLHLRHVQFMPELFDFYLKLFFPAAWSLRRLAFAPPVFKPGLAELDVAVYPAIDLLLTDVVPDGGLTVVPAVGQTFPGDPDAFFFGGGP